MMKTTGKKTCKKIYPQHPIQGGITNLLNFNRIPLIFCIARSFITTNQQKKFNVFKESGVSTVGLINKKSRFAPLYEKWQVKTTQITSLRV